MQQKITSTYSKRSCSEYYNLICYTLTHAMSQAYNNTLASVQEPNSELLIHSCWRETINRKALYKTQWLRTQERTPMKKKEPKQMKHTRFYLSNLEATSYYFDQHQSFYRTRFRFSTSDSASVPSQAEAV